MRLVPVHRLRMDFLGTTEVCDVIRDALEDDAMALGDVVLVLVVGHGDFQFSEESVCGQVRSRAMSTKESIRSVIEVRHRWPRGSSSCAGGGRRGS